MKKFEVLKRIRKPSPSPLQFLRLNRAEFASTFKKLEYDFENYYPDINPLLLSVSKYFSVKNKNVFIGAGAETIIKDLFLLMYLKNKKNVLLNPTNFFMYNYYSKLFNFKQTNYIFNPIDIKSLTVKSIKSKLNNKNIDLIILVNPSHPFENYFNKEKIKEILNICKKKDVFVLLDEVYLTNNKISSINLIRRYKNLIILKSLSKVPGFPGLRVAFAFGDQNIINELNTVRLAIEMPEYNIRKASKYLSKPLKYIDPRIKEIIDARKFANKEFKKRNIKSFGKYGNSVSAVLNNKKDVLELGDYLEKNKILINYKYKTPFEKFINITTTNKKNLRYFFKFFDQFSKNKW